MADNLKFKRLGTMIDSSRNAVMKPEAVKKWIEITADMGYNCAMLYIEDTYEVDGNPYFGHLRGRYTKEELKDIDDFAASKGVEFIPCIQTLAHLKTIFKWKPYAPINDCNDILLADNENTYELIDKMFLSLKRCLRTKIINIGMDEAHMLGRGKYMDLHGCQDRMHILINHLNKVSEIAKNMIFSF